MIHKLQETRRELDLPSERMKQAADIVSPAKMGPQLAQKNKEARDVIQNMRNSNGAALARTLAFRSKSEAMIASTESYILAERSLKKDTEESSNQIFRLTSPKDKSGVSNLPLLGSPSSKTLKTQANLYTSQKRRLLPKKEAEEIGMEIVKESNMKQLQKSTFLTQNTDFLSDEIDIRAGKKHRKIAIVRQLQNPLFKYDQDLLIQELEENAVKPTNADFEAYSRRIIGQPPVTAWAECKILAKVAPGKYAIEWISDKKRKIVDRLNLRFADEMNRQITDELNDKYRVALSKQYEDLFAKNYESRLI
jgi:hypothetical protein